MPLTVPLTTDSARVRSRRTFLVPLLVTLALLITFPLFADSIGLYTYLGIEVAIWSLN